MKKLVALLVMVVFTASAFAQAQPQKKNAAEKPAVKMEKKIEAAAPAVEKAATTEKTAKAEKVAKTVKAVKAKKHTKTAKAEAPVIK